MSFLGTDKRFYCDVTLCTEASLNVFQPLPASSDIFFVLWIIYIDLSRDNLLGANKCRQPNLEFMGSTSVRKTRACVLWRKVSILLF